MEYDSAYVYSLNPVLNDEANRSYWETTPSGSLSLTIIKAKGKLFEVGKDYLIDIQEAN